MIKKQKDIASLPKKEKRIRITATLLNSWQYIWDCKNYVYEGENDEICYEEKLKEAQEKAKQDFINMLNRIPTPDNEFMKKGREFEDKVCSGNDSVFSPIVENGIFQLKITKNIDIDGVPVILYGVLDVLKKGKIYDIKRVQKYKYPKYKTSHQHTLYLFLVPEAIDFEYLICDDKVESPIIEKRKEAYHHEHYIRENCEDIISVLRNFINYLKANDLFEIWINKWAM